MVVNSINVETGTASRPILSHSTGNEDMNSTCTDQLAICSSGI